MVQHVATRVAVVGAGYAGLACAVELADAGIAVDVFEASRTLGGRARAVDLDGLTVDNGAHILVGAYRETLRLMQKVDVHGTTRARVGAGGTAAHEVSPPARAGLGVGGTKVGAGGTALLKRQPLHLEFPGHVRIAAPRLPAPLHLAWALLAASGLSLTEKFAAIGFMRAQQARDFRLPADMPAADLFAAHRQPERVRRFLWEPLCLAALNTPVAIASAQVFLNVLKDSLAAGRDASDLLLPATDFSSLFPEPAARYIEAHGGRVLRSTRIHSLDELADYEHRVIAVAPQHLAALTPDIAAGLNFSWQPIATGYLQYPEHVRLPFAMVGMDTSGGGHAQWLFDRGILCGQDGLLAAVISGAGPWQQLGHEALAAAIHAEIAGVLPGLPPPRRTQVIEEKRATFCCTPDLDRPGTATASPNLWLAGDYVAGPYPATLEGAVRSGVVAARSILGQLPGHQA